MAVRAFLDLPDSVSVRIGPAGLLVGRQRGCDLQLSDHSASRRHALLRVSADGVELVVLGQKPVYVGEVACTSLQLLRDGERLRFPGLECRVRVESFEESVPVDYCVRRGSDRIRIHASPFVLGMGAAANLSIAGWPEEVAWLRIAQGVLYLEAMREGVMVDRAAVEVRDPVALAPGASISFGSESLQIEQAEPGEGSTVTGTDVLAKAVVLHPLPRGGRIAFTFSDGERTVYLPGRRYQLLSALIAPPAPLVTGEFVPDSEVIPLVWTDEEVGGRTEMNVLLTRCRHDLVAAGISATTLIERAPGGRATRVCLAPGAKITTASGSDTYPSR